MFDTDQQVRRAWAGESTELPSYFVEWMKRDLGQFWDWLPPGALEHDPNAYLKAEAELKHVPEPLAQIGVNSVVTSAG